jgi:uncharacterized protein (TIGR02271 family)
LSRNVDTNIRTIFGLFDDHKSAKQAAEALEKSGFSEKHISILNKADKAELADLKKSMNDRDVDFYIDCVENDGSTLVIVDSEEGKVSKAAEILSKHGMVDADQRAQAHAKAHGKKDVLRDYKDSDQVMKVVQESLEVGKREVERGRVRVYNRITSKEVEEKVGLRDETIHVQRRAVDRPAEAGTVDELFKERSFEVREVDEEAVVSKVARVLEEVVVSKEVAQRVQTIRDTVRRSDVEVEEIHSHPAFESLDKKLHDYYAASLAKSGHKYDDYLPAFKFGYSLATSEHTHDRSWADLEASVRKNWEQKNPGTWGTYKTAIHHAFDEVHA